MYNQLPPFSWNPFNTKIGLALGGGAAKGVAHIGVIRAIEEENVAISCVSGTSIGALVAAYYAFGKNSADLHKIAEELTFKKLSSFNWNPMSGFFTTEALREMLLRDLGDVKIEDAETPLAICAADIDTVEQVIFEEGNLADAICASVAVPGLFAPADVQGRKLVDGGIVENVPISLLKSLGAGITIGVDLNGVTSYQSPKNALEVFGNAIDICINRKTRDQLKQADLAISLDLSKYNRTDNREQTENLINDGYYPAKQLIRQAVFYKRANLIRYLLKVIRELLPVKMPHVISRFFETKTHKVKLK